MVTPLVLVALSVEVDPRGKSISYWLSSGHSFRIDLNLYKSVEFFTHTNENHTIPSTRFPSQDEHRMLARPGLIRTSLSLIVKRMASTTHAEFNTNTEALDVAKAFAPGVRGKTVLVTGVNRGGIGFATAQAFVNTLTIPNLITRIDRQTGISVSRTPHHRQPYSFEDTRMHRCAQNRLSKRGLSISRTRSL